jgi:hypothetical protein
MSSVSSVAVHLDRAMKHDHDGCSVPVPGFDILSGLIFPAVPFHGRTNIESNRRLSIMSDM